MERTQLTYVDIPSGSSITRVTKRTELKEALLAHHK